MPDRDWATIRNFKREEWIKDPDKVSWDVVMLLDQMREDSGVPIHINVAWDDTGHVNDSGHYTTSRDFCTAVDFYFVGMSLLDQWLFAERYPWYGIGVYPFWRVPGLHCDLKRIGREHATLGRRWYRNERDEYVPLDRRCVSLMLLTANKEGET